MTLIEKDKSPVTFQAKARDVFDVTGAGDTVVAVLAACIANGLSLADAVNIANIGASIVVGKLGASTVSRQELLAVLAQASDSKTLHERAHHLIVSKESLKSAMREAKQNGETVVMTNGCFDLLHKGHVTYLEQARKLGQRLIVALNSDASITRLKGDSRPIMDESSRATVLASLSSVDWVVIFEEDTPQSLIEYLLPDVLVKGGDYEISTIAGADAVIQNGGSVEIIDLVAGYSTSNAVNKIKADAEIKRNNLSSHNE
jgi:D-beta-D-heptose 7-phosphate kinase/D-beta-D-heptose 1-phosphate adenosyltransferase